MQVLDVLRKVDQIIELAKPMAAGTAFGEVLGIIDTTIETAVLFAMAGKDPVAEIQRIHDADPALQQMKGEWDKRIDDKFGTGGD